MKTNFFALAILIAAGAVIANLIVNPGAAKSLFGFLEKVWKWAVNSMMGNS
jgi:hypothetical protein